MNPKATVTNADKKNWWYIISPCVLAAVFSLSVIILSLFEMEHSGGWSFIGVIVFLPVLLIIGGIDLIVKLIVRKKVLCMAS